MTGLLNAVATRAPAVNGTSFQAARPAYHAYVLLQICFAFLPVVTGLDKFFHLLVNWDQYLAPLAKQILPVPGHTFMIAVGVIEITAGMLVGFRPRIGAYVVALWLWGIIVNLLLIQDYYDIAVRDFGLSIGALALARLSLEFNPSPLRIGSHLVSRLRGTAS